MNRFDESPFPTRRTEDGTPLPEPERCVRCDDGLTLRDATTRDAMGLWHTSCLNLSLEEHEIAMQDAEELAASEGPKIRAYLLAQGWQIDGDGYELGGDYRVDLSGAYGYVWELQRFSDSDVEGVAVGRWVSTDVSGDTLTELRAVLPAPVIDYRNLAVGLIRKQAAWISKTREVA